MENALVVGINTRSVACSLKKLGFNVYSADYFGTIDLQECTTNYLSILSQEPHHSCGHFTLNYKSGSIDDLAADFVDSADFIICLAGSSPLNFPQKKVWGNKDIRDVENKYRLYKKLKDHFRFPRTYGVADIEEADEIAGNYPEKDFILKPISGSGGYGIRELKMLDENSVLTLDFPDFILQEQLKGQNISVSVLSTGQDSHTILTSQQIIGDADLGQKEPYGYCGNITPLIDGNDAAGTAEEIINHLSLVGSNGVDFILQEDDLYLIEVNPRIQGTIECAETSLGINMVEAHLEASGGTLVDVPPPNRFAVKIIVHAQERSQVGRLNFKGVYDIPAENVIVEEGEPVATVVSSSNVLEDAIYSARQMVDRIYSQLKFHP